MRLREFGIMVRMVIADRKKVNSGEMRAKDCKLQNSHFKFEICNVSMQVIRAERAHSLEKRDAVVA